MDYPTNSFNYTGRASFPTVGNVDNHDSDKPVILSVLFAFIAMLGISGNSLVLFVFFKVPELRIFTNTLIANQSVVDLISSILLIVTFVPPTINLKRLNSANPILAGLICKLWVSQFTYWAVIKISTTNLVCLTMERYFAIVYPLKYLAKASKHTAGVVCLSAWVVGTLSAVYFPITHYVSAGGECNKTALSDGASVAIALLAFVTTFVIPILVMMFVYMSIYFILRPNKELSSSLAQVTYTASTSDPEDGSTRMTPRERGRRNVLVTFVLVCLVYVVCWTPDQILYLIHNLTRDLDWSKPGHMFTILLAASNVCTNPIIYTLKYESFQRGLKKVFLRGSPSYRHYAKYNVTFNKDRYHRPQS